MKLISIEATDFCLFEHVTLALDGQGLVWIGGVNKDSDAANSNGSGKSTVLKAIAWGLYGESIDGKHGDEAIREGTKCATVVIVFEHDGERWTLTRLRRKGQPRLELQRVGDEEKWPGSRAMIQEKLDAMMGMDFRAFRNTVLYGQGDRKRFTDPSTSDADRKALFNSILRNDILAVCHEWVKGEALKLKREMDKVETTVSTLKGRIAEHDIPALQAEHDGWADEQGERVKTLAQQAREALDKAKSATAKRAEAERLQEAIDAEPVPDLAAAAEGRKAAQRSLNNMQEARNVIRGERDVLKAKLAGVDEQLELVDGESACPVCTSPLDEGHAGEHIAFLRALQAGLKGKLALANTNLAKAVASLEAAEVALEEAEADGEAEHERAEARGAEQARVSILLAEAGRAEDYAQEAKAKTAEAREAAGATNPHAKSLKAAKAKVKEYKQEMKGARARLDELGVERAHYQFWVRGFSNQGLPSFILDSVMPYITERANHYLDILADGDITMNFATQRELKSSKGEMRDEITIGWEIEGVSEYAPSGGQLKKMEIATDLALMDLVATREGAHPDILMLDEILDGLDAEGRNRVTHLLHELRKARETILVISHDESIAEVFEKAVIVVKDGGTSRLEARAAA